MNLELSNIARIKTSLSSDNFGLEIFIGALGLYFVVHK